MWYIFSSPGLRSLQGLIPFCQEFYTNDFGLDLFSDFVKEYFFNGLEQREAETETPQLSVSESEDKKNKVSQHNKKYIGYVFSFHLLCFLKIDFI